MEGQRTEVYENSRLEAAEGTPSVIYFSVSLERKHAIALVSRSWRKDQFLSPTSSLLTSLNRLRQMVGHTNSLTLKHDGSRRSYQKACLLRHHFPGAVFVLTVIVAFT